MAGVPIAMTIKAAGLFEHPRQLEAAWTHKLDVGPRRFMSILEGPLLLRLAPEDLIRPVGVERRININEINRGIGQLAQLLQVVAAVDDARVQT